MNSVDQAVVAINFVGSGAAVLACLWAAEHFRGAMRIMWLAVFLLALAYWMSFGWLLLNQDRAGEWSRTMRYFGSISWFAAWVAPAVTATRSLQKREAQFDEITISLQRVAKLTVETTESVDG
jgi:uncharacterized membrane protein YfcA